MDLALQNPVYFYLNNSFQILFRIHFSTSNFRTTKNHEIGLLSESCEKLAEKKNSILKNRDLNIFASRETSKRRGTILFGNIRKESTWMCRHLSDFCITTEFANLAGTIAYTQIVAWIAAFIAIAICSLKMLKKLFKNCQTLVSWKNFKLKCPETRRVTRVVTDNKIKTKIKVFFCLSR